MNNFAVFAEILLPPPAIRLGVCCRGRGPTSTTALAIGCEARPFRVTFASRSDSYRFGRSRFGSSGLFGNLGFEGFVPSSEGFGGSGLLSGSFGNLGFGGSGPC